MGCATASDEGAAPLRPENSDFRIIGERTGDDDSDRRDEDGDSALAGKTDFLVGVAVVWAAKRGVVVVGGTIFGVCFKLFLIADK